MTIEERDELLGTQRTCRMGTVGANQAPHVSALWFVWTGTSLWCSTIVGSQRWVNIERNPMVSVLVDGGTSYQELHGVEIIGAASVVGEVPRVGEHHGELEPIENLFTIKYGGGGPMHYDGRHAWLQVVPQKIVSWDFRKIPAGP